MVPLATTTTVALADTQLGTTGRTGPHGLRERQATPGTTYHCALPASNLATLMVQPSRAAPGTSAPPVITSR